MQTKYSVVLYAIGAPPKRLPGEDAGRTGAGSLPDAFSNSTTAFTPTSVDGDLPIGDAVPALAAVAAVPNRAPISSRHRTE